MRRGAALLLALWPVSALADTCLMQDRDAMLSCLQARSEQCLTQAGGGAAYRMCLDALDVDVLTAMEEAASGFEDTVMAEIGAQYLRYVAVEQALWVAWRDSSCKTRAYLTYQTGSAAASAMIRCRTRANASRWHDLMFVPPESWQGP